MESGAAEDAERSRSCCARALLDLELLTTNLFLSFPHPNHDTPPTATTERMLQTDRRARSVLNARKRGLY